MANTLISMNKYGDIDVNNLQCLISNDARQCIQRILSESTKLQKRHGLSNACGFVNIVLWKCFTIANIPVDVVYGQIEIQGTVVPHVWLEVYGFIIDNTYMEDIPEQIHTEIKRQCIYTKADCMRLDKLFLGDEVTQERGIDNHDILAFKWMLSNKDKMILLSYNKTSMKRYYTDMSTLMKHIRGITELPDIENVSCWLCGTVHMHLKRCGKCKIAIYCDKNCQRQDWVRIHKRICSG